jgi:hypothetical protein
LAIGRAPTPRRSGYFVMNWNFSTVDPVGDAGAIRGALHRHINVQIAATVAKYRDQLHGEVQVHPDDALVSFQSLLAAVSASPHRLYLLIDEYDNFANEVLASRDRGEDRYHEPVGGEGVIKTVFKAIKAAAEGRGLDRVFITGVSPVVMADITSGYNVVKDISLQPELADLCGFHETEIAAVLQQIIADCKLPAAQVDEALAMMRTFYNGYRFSPSPDVEAIYNPTLALYFFEHLAERCAYPRRMLDNNLAMDRNRIDYIARLPHGKTLVKAALNGADPIEVADLDYGFGVEQILKAPETEGLLGFAAVLLRRAHAGRARHAGAPATGHPESGGAQALRGAAAAGAAAGLGP